MFNMQRELLSISDISTCVDMQARASNDKEKKVTDDSDNLADSLHTSRNNSCGDKNRATNENTKKKKKPLLLRILQATLCGCGRQSTSDIDTEPAGSSEILFGYNGPENGPPKISEEESESSAGCQQNISNFSPIPQQLSGRFEDIRSSQIQKSFLEDIEEDSEQLNDEDIRAEMYWMNEKKELQKEDTSSGGQKVMVVTRFKGDLDFPMFFFLP